ncbi:MAG TPA: peptidase, partial [Allosphingosinicella sp.]|nr:peptidase [Allosphingosinicella sp.]
MSARLRSILVLAAAGLGLAACSHYDGYGYGGVSVGYGSRYCDPYYDDCYGYGYGYGYGGGYAYDPWWGWYGNYYYPGIGIYVFDRFGRRHRWSDDHRRHWEGRRHRWRDRDWNDRRWERWDGFRGDRRDWRRGDWRRGDRDGGRWRDRSSRRDWDENPRSFRREGIRQQSSEPRVRSETRVRTEGRISRQGGRTRTE